MSPRYSPSYKQRGTIIVDANVLQHLFCEVNQTDISESYRSDRKTLEDAQTKRIKHYLGILEFLGRHGFHIVVPEMVALESGSVLACGTDMIKHTELPPADCPKLYHPQLSMLLQRVANNKYPGIVIVEVRERDHPDLLATYDSSQQLREIKKLPKGSKVAQEKLKAWFKQREKNLGEAAIKGYITSSRQTGMDNIFVLTDDGNAMRSISTECDVRVINTNGLLRPFISTALHKTVGLRDDITSGYIQDQCVQSRISRTGKEHHKNRSWIDGRFDETGKTYDTEGFKRTLEELAADMKIASWQERVKASREKDQTREPS